MMLKSDNVSLANLAPQLALACVMANEVYNDYDVDMVITSANDSNHSTTSLHYAGAAVDLRTYTLDESKRSECVERIRKKVGGDFDVILESNHIHMEYQPRKK